ncbi:MAG: hypothetical protein ACRDQ1_03185 [Sciscionella sp.]
MPTVKGVEQLDRPGITEANVTALQALHPDLGEVITQKRVHS